MLLSSLVPTDPLRTDDATYFARRATVTFGIDHAEPQSLPNLRVWEVWEQAERDGWTGAEFRRAVDAFVLRQKFPTWTVADFFAEPRPKVHGHAWYAEQTTAGRGAEVGRYVVTRPNGEPQVVWGWRSECDGMLPEHRFTPEAGAPPNPAAPESPTATAADVMAPDVREQWDAIKEAAKAGAALDEEKRTTARLRNEHQTDRKRIAQLEDEVASLKQQLANIADRREVQA